MRDKKLLRRGVVAMCVVVGTGMASVSFGREGDVAGMYAKAATGVVVEGPASSTLTYRDYPPFGVEWDKLAKAAWEKNGVARRLAREVRLNGGPAEQVQWPATEEDWRYLNQMRVVSNEVADAAMYQHLLGNDGEAMELIEDLLYESRALRLGKGGGAWVRGLVGVGIDASAMSRLLAMAPTMKISVDGSGGGVRIERVRAMISELLVQETGEELLRRSYGEKYPDVMQAAAMKSGSAAGSPQEGVERFIETFLRANAEKGYAAMSLAAQMFEREKGRWPGDMKELVPAFLPKEMVDPWGDGNVTLGYVVVKGGRPDGGDRPMVFGRWEGKGGLMYRVDEPQYSFYSGDGSARPHAEQVRGGQFRDLTLWEGTPGTGRDAKMQKLEGTGSK